MEERRENFYVTNPEVYKFKFMDTDGTHKQLFVIARDIKDAIKYVENSAGAEMTILSIEEITTNVNVDATLNGYKAFPTADKFIFSLNIEPTLFTEYEYDENINIIEQHEKFIERLCGSLKNAVKDSGIRLIQEPKIDGDRTKMFYERVVNDDFSDIMRIYVNERSQHEHGDYVTAYDVNDIKEVLNLRTRVRNYAEFKERVLKIDGIKKIDESQARYIINDKNKKSLFGLYILG
jgi:hypothetical protein